MIPPRPMPPVLDMETMPARVAPDVLQWLRAAMIDPTGPLHSESHAHLEQADIGVLWTDVLNVSKQRSVLGMAESPMPPPATGKWARARWEADMIARFGSVPDFILTFYAPAVAEMSDTDWCRIARHELLHCAQAVDEFGCPKFSRETGLPKYCIRGHDVEEFVEVVADFGPTEPVKTLIEASVRPPRFGLSTIQGACGTCRKGL